MPHHRVVSHQEWLEARKVLLDKEKAHTKARDALTAARMAMPWRLVEKDYRFAEPDGEVGLGDLFAGKSQLIVHHFMFGADWDEGCSGCSFMADSIDPLLVHLGQRDVAFAAISIAPVDKLMAFRERMSWSFAWVSSVGTDFNRDFDVTIDEDDIVDGNAHYNFGPFNVPHAGELPGVSVFVRGEDGTIYHSYSAYARGLETTMAAYNFLDLVPKGRDEDDLAYGTEWLKLRDAY